MSVRLGTHDSTRCPIAYERALLHCWNNWPGVPDWVVARPSWGRDALTLDKVDRRAAAWLAKQRNRDEARSRAVAHGTGAV